MNIETIITADGVGLKGLFLEASNSDKVCLFIPGCGGNFVDNDFIRIIGMELSKKKYSVLCANTRGSFMMNYSFHPQNLEKPVQIGAAYERFEDCIYDIDAWIKHLILKGYKKIDVICHSSGSNKLIYYLNNDVQGKYFINNVVFLSPPDFANKIRSFNDYEELLEEAKKNVEAGNPNKLIKIHFFYKTSLGFLSMMESKNFDNIPLVNGKQDDFYQYANITNPIFILYGSKEIYIKNYICKLINFANPRAVVKCREIEQADHIYFGKEDVVSRQIISYLDKSYLHDSHTRLTLKKETKI